MRHSFVLAMALALVAFLVPGCNKPTPANVQEITTVAVEIGFDAWATKNPTQAAAVAQQVNQGATNALAYLQGAQGVASSVLDATVQAKLTEGLPEEIQQIIVAAAGILDQVLPIPAPDQYLTPGQLAYLIAFVQGVKDGTADIGTRAVKVVDSSIVKKVKGLKSGHWLSQPIKAKQAAPKAVPSK